MRKKFKKSSSLRFIRVIKEKFKGSNSNPKYLTFGPKTTQKLFTPKINLIHVAKIVFDLRNESHANWIKFGQKVFFTSILTLAASPDYFLKSVLKSGLKSGYQIQIQFKSRFRISNSVLIRISDYKSGFNPDFGFLIQIKIVF
jgi:hypothetical protein